MNAYRPDRVVRALNALVSFAYSGLWVVAVVLLIGAPAAKLMARGENWTWSLQVPATLQESQSLVNTSWGPARLVVDDATATLHLPVATLPWSLFGVMWTHVAVAFALTLLFLHHLRRIFQRVRDGAPFDADNALRMRSLGLLLLALVVLDGIADFATSLAVDRVLPPGAVALVTGPRIDMPLIFAALVLIVLAEIFRRGAELEREQALVI
jgi:hypothetical protein